MKSAYITIIVIILILGAFFIFSNNSESNINSTQPNKGTTGENAESVKVEWRTAELIDVKTGEKFTISQFNKPIVLESFAVWCPTCTKQQSEIKKLHDELGDSFISISLDTDPNEDAQKVLEHIERNGFNWFYAISPKEVTKSLIDEFGIGFVNAPSAPVIIIDENKNARILRNGVKSADELKEELELWK